MDCIYLGELIKNGRANANLTQKELGNLLNVSDKAISKWERGICYPDISLIAPISEILDLPITKMLSSEDKRNIKEQSLNRKLLITCILFLIIGIICTFSLLLLPIGFLKRIHIFALVISYLLLFVISILITHHIEKRNFND